MTHPFHYEKLDEKWNNFLSNVKSELTDRFEHLQSVTNIDGKNPKQLHEIIWMIETSRGITWAINDDYEIKENIRQKIDKIFSQK